MIHVDLGGYAFHSRFPYLDQLPCEEMNKFQHVFRPSGYVYSPLGGLIDGIPQLERYRILMVLRDPRDVLTSEYFSMAHSHRLPPVAGDKHRQFAALRRRARALPIDEYVVSESPRVVATYRRYIDGLLKPGYSTALLTYEEMILDFPEWLLRLQAFCGFSMSSQLQERLVSAARHSASRKERIDSHARQVLPGDHRRKLKRQTIDELNGRFEDVLTRLGYEAS
jgi:hypothetical protein